MADWLSLLRSSPPASDEELAGLANFKLGCGLLCELAVLLLSPSTPLPVEEKVTVWRLLARLWLQCSVESGVEALVRVGASCLRHLVLHSSATWNAVDARLWNVAASALHLTVQSSLATVQNHLRHLEASMPPVQDSTPTPSSHRSEDFRLLQLSQQIFGMTATDAGGLSAADPVVIDAEATAIVVALLSQQLAINNIANIIRCNNTLFVDYETVLSKALFVENVEPCASDVGVEDLASLSDALRGCVEFGVDFQRATGVRQRLRHCFGSDFGLRSSPSLGAITRLCSDLLLIGLCHLAAASAAHRPQLHQWLRFLVEFHDADLTAVAATPSPPSPPAAAAVLENYRRRRKAYRLSAAAMPPKPEEEQLNAEETSEESNQPVPSEEEALEGSATDQKEGQEQVDERDMTLSTDLLVSTVQLLMRLDHRHCAAFADVAAVLAPLEEALLHRGGGDPLLLRLCGQLRTKFGL